MKTNSTKETALLIGSLIALFYFGYVLFFPNFTTDYNFYENKLGQFAFFGSCMILIYNFLKFINKEKLFPFSVTFLLIVIIYFYLLEKTFLSSLIFVAILSLFFFYTRKYLVAKSLF